MTILPGYSLRCTIIRRKSQSACNTSRSGAKKAGIIERLGGYQELRAVLSSEIPHIRVCQIITCHQRTKSGRMRCFLRFSLPGEALHGRWASRTGYNPAVS